MKPSEAAIEAMAQAQWNYECDEPYALGTWTRWDKLPEESKEQQRKNIRSTLPVAYAIDFPEETSK